MKKIDAKDRRILHELKHDGRMSNVELAERVNLSPSTCLRRVQELERAGVIRGYRVVTDPERLGHGFVAYVSVGLSLHSKAALEDFENSMRQAEEVIECHNVAGTFEYLLRIESEDLASYKRFHSERLGTHPYVSAITTYLVMHSPKDERA
ncbi:Lrp/AsnC family transcriptional regulator [Salinisphaera hydrothermalis]|uniref:Leucine-responsive regulatory protein n=1 Tax=Salinisphaera hydrothermalis (strain C41B8) TaxID=1304275 RepID=A0A084INF9_SALHC|nr:Lrp/AsnC family transcriptional regulator [Salinisphaera hydrothermalis]KEZ78243.1 AsnC family transcriptional regulator [Salinisphaera hydrothermalis C41B8]